MALFRPMLTKKMQDRVSTFVIKEASVLFTIYCQYVLAYVYGRLWDISLI